MCDSKPGCTRVLVSAILCVAGFVMAARVQADQVPTGCLPQSNVGIAVFCDPAATQPIVGQNVVVGQTIYYQARLSHSSSSDCAVEGGRLEITTPDGVTTNATTGVTIPIVCGVGGCPIGSVSEFKSQVIPYKVRAVDIGVSQSGVAPCNPTPAGRIQAKATYAGGISHCDDNESCDPTASISACNPAVIAALTVTKAVACTTGQVCNASLAYSSSASGAKDSDTNPKFCYRFIFSNTGTATLNVTSVVDTVLGSLTPPGGLPPGAVVTNFSGPVEHASTQNNTVTVLAAQTSQSCFQTTLVAQANASANVINTPISCEVRFVQNSQLLSGNPGNCTSCQADVGILPSANSISVVVRITNTAGNGQNIVNGVVSVGGNNFNVAGPIAPGSFADVTVDTIAGNALGCHAYAADVVFQGANTDNCPPLNTSCSKSLEICGQPCVRIVKLVKCLEVGECLEGLCSSNTGLYSPSATGVKDAGFCYSITITNCGTLPLTNVVVTDNQLGGSLGFNTTLGIGASETRFFQKSYPGLVGDVRNTATVTGQSAGGQVSATTNALVHLLNPSITCTKQVSVDGGAFTSGGSIEVPFESAHDLTFRVIVRNNGDVDLQNVQVIDTGTSGCPVSTNIIASLPAGASVTNVLCTITGVSCPPTVTLSNIVNVCAEVTTNVCSINPANCQRITVCSSCNNTITLTCTPPGACRTTGGGKQPTEDTCPEVRYVTHGGQVGASFGVAGAPDCATDTGFNNPCIRGEYQHVRHIKGGLRGVFHAAGNGNENDFDSLMCACLPCDHTDTPSLFGGCHPADRCYGSENPTSPGKKNALCNPDDRICGPEPRRAPANKICFSGVGNYTMSNGKKAPQSVVFRVDLEDRSEPGGAFPKGAKAPPDRYRMRMWFIAAGTADSAAVKALRATVACKDATCEIIPATLDCVGGPTPAPDIDDGGDLDRGNRQIHPSTGASCH